MDPTQFQIPNTYRILSPDINTQTNLQNAFNIMPYESLFLYHQQGETNINTQTMIPFHFLRPFYYQTHENMMGFYANTFFINPQNNRNSESYSQTVGEDFIQGNFIINICQLF